VRPVSWCVTLPQSLMVCSGNARSNSESSLRALASSLSSTKAMNSRFMELYFSRTLAPMRRLRSSSVAKVNSLLGGILQPRTIFPRPITLFFPLVVASCDKWQPAQWFPWLRCRREFRRSLGVYPLLLPPPTQRHWRHRWQWSGKDFSARSVRADYDRYDEPSFSCFGVQL